MPKSGLLWVSSLVLIGCAGSITNSQNDPDKTPDDPVVTAQGGDGLPKIVMESPARGQTQSGGTVVVKGRATDQETSVVQVLVNGANVALGPDGSFQTEVTVPLGLSVITTDAFDTTGAQATDLRSVLAGTTASIDNNVSNSIAGNIGPQALNIMAGKIQNLIAGTNFTSAVTTLNPVAEKGGSCLNAKIYVDSVSFNGVTVNAAPTYGGVAVAVTLDNINISGRALYEAACIDGQEDWSITANSYTATATVTNFLNGGTMYLGLEDLQSGFSGFDLHLDNIPGAVADFIRNQSGMEAKIRNAIRDKIASTLPSKLNDVVAEFVGGSRSVTVLGQSVNFSIWPTQVEWSPSGGYFTFDSRASMNSASGPYLSSPTSPPSASTLASASQGLRIAAADDLLNQLIAMFFHGHVLEYDFYVIKAGDLAAGIAGNVEKVHLKPLLPPTVSAESASGSLKLLIGDLEVEAFDKAGKSLAKILVASTIDLATEVTTDGRLKIQAGKPQVWSQIVEQAEDLSFPLTQGVIAGVAEYAVSGLVKDVNDMLANLPLPSVAGVSVSYPTFELTSGYVIAGGTLQ